MTPLTTYLSNTMRKLDFKWVEKQADLVAKYYVKSASFSTCMQSVASNLHG
jgi:hypothetical protein